MGMDISGIGNGDAYFRANVWSWRPIQVIIESAISNHNLEINTEGFGENSGYGVDSAEACLALREAILKEMVSFGLNEPNSTVYMSLGGSWVTESGRFVPSDVVKSLELSELQDQVFNSGIVAADGTMVYPAYSVDKEHLDEFCEFLKECDGFEIW